METNAILIWCTAPDGGTADRIATALVDAKLAACVSISPEVRSVYRWQGQIERSDEVLMTIKTKQEAYDRLEAALRELHPYDVPEIVAVPVTSGLADYVAWIGDSVE